MEEAQKIFYELVQSLYADKGVDYTNELINKAFKEQEIEFDIEDVMIIDDNNEYDFIEDNIFLCRDRAICFNIQKDLFYFNPCHAIKNMKKYLYEDMMKRLKKIIP